MTLALDVLLSLDVVCVRRLVSAALGRGLQLLYVTVVWFLVLMRSTSMLLGRLVALLVSAYLTRRPV